jgi:GNAT superfamily N-acetyltransferase
MSQEPQLRIVDPDAVVDLRHRILRAGLPRETAMFEGDGEVGTVHLAAFDEWNVMIGCVTILHRMWNGTPAWQLRGMAVESEWQGHGIGRMLLSEVERLILCDSHSTLVWCNARKPAVGFYERHGWRLASPEFEIPTAGPHHKMTRHLEDEP